MHFLAFEERILHRLITASMGAKEQAKLKFGFYIFADTLKKGFIVYISAVILEVFWQTLIVHISFLLIRHVTYGWHSSTSKACIIKSVIVFSLAPYLVSNLVITPLMIYISAFLIFTMIYIFGPTETQKNPIKIGQRKSLKYKLKIRLLILLVTSYFIPVDISQYVVIGAVIQLTTLLIQFKLNRRNQYV